MERLDAGLHVFYGHEVEPHLRLLARHVGDAGVLAPLPQIDAVLVADGVEPEVAGLGLPSESLENPLRNGNVVHPGRHDLEQGRLENQVGIRTVHPLDPRPGVGEPRIIDEKLLMPPRIDRPPDEFGPDREEHPLVVLRPVHSVVRGFGTGEKLRLGHGARKVVVQHLFRHRSAREGVIARIGHGSGPLRNLGPPAPVPLLFAARRQKQAGRSE